MISFYRKHEEPIKVIFAVSTLMAIIGGVWRLNNAFGEMESAKEERRELKSEMSSAISSMNSNFDALQIMLLQSGLAVHGKKIAMLEEAQEFRNKQFDHVEKRLNEAIK